MKKPLVVGNWKLNHNLVQTAAFLDQAVVLLKSYTDVQIAVAPVTTLLYLASEKTRNSNIGVAAQNVYFESEGAFTGEYSVFNLTELGCKYAIVGHSERRQYFNETNETTALKTKACFKGNLLPIVCLGESLEVRSLGQTRKFLQEQLNPILRMLNKAECAHFILAYEPIWAIGTGKSALPADVEDVHLFLRSILSEQFGKEIAEQASILYGGSVKPQNTTELISQPNVDGLLVGGASLDINSFVEIIQKVNKMQLI